MFAPTRRLLSALPVTLAEFRESLASIWLPRLRVEPRLGLAVSGGVDSMALATLCSDLALVNEDDPDDRFRAFIVDHKLREESTEEALSVKKALGDLGIHSEILQMQWPTNVDPKKLAGLEHHARKLRFRLLGQACRNHGIEALLLAHHSDDQAETVMMRLLDGHQGRGLRGIRQSNDIPESFGIHGVHRSHASDETSDMDIPFALNDQHAMDIEHGGVQVLRPLLPFAKERLIATCLEAETPWVEDKTNKDPTLTPRNAIRHLFENYRLPAALGKSALLGISQRLSEKMEQQSQEVDDMIRNVDAVLDVRSGDIAVRFPRNFFPPTTMNFAIPLFGKHGWDDAHYNLTSSGLEREKIIGAMFLQRLIHNVTPYESVSLSQLEMATRHVFPKIFVSNRMKPGDAHVPSSFTVGGVLFEELAAPEIYFPYHTWLLSRQPYSGNKPLPSLSIPPAHKQEIFEGGAFEEEEHSIVTQFDGKTETTGLMQPNTATEHDHQDVEAASDAPSKPSPTPQKPGFQLYDGRFWIRVHNPSTTRHLIVRPFRPADLKPLRASLQGNMHMRFEGLRVDAAKSKGRYTLPVIATVDPDDSTNSGTILAMPTFGVKINKGPLAEEWAGLRWDVRYKRLDSSVLVRDSWDDYPRVAKRSRNS